MEIKARILSSLIVNNHIQRFNRQVKRRRNMNFIIHQLMKSNRNCHKLTATSILKIKARYGRIWMKDRKSNWWPSFLKNNTSDWNEYFRMSKETFEYICSVVEDDLTPKPQLTSNSRKPVSVKKQVAIAILTLATSSKYQVVGALFEVHKTTVRKCIVRFCESLTNQSSNFIYMPQDIEALEISTKFEAACHIPNILGCIDGSHIPITAPSNGYRDFINRKHYASYVLQAVVDCDYM